MMKISASEFVAAYANHREYIESENRHVNERLSRTLLVHGFLIASFVLLIQAKAQAIAQAAAAPDLEKAFVRLNGIFNLADLTLPIVGAMGVLTSITAFLGLVGASIATSRLKKNTETLLGLHPEYASLLPLATPTGGGSIWAAFFGWSSAYGLLALLTVFWMLILCSAASFAKLSWWPKVLTLGGLG